MSECPDRWPLTSNSQMTMNPKYRLLSILALTVILAGCVSTTTFAPNVSFKDYPEIGKETTGSIGSPLVLKSKVMASQGFDLLGSITVKSQGVNMGQSFELSPSEFFAAREDKKYIYYESADINAVKSFSLGMRMDALAVYPEDGSKVWVQSPAKSGIRIRRERGLMEAYVLIGSSIYSAKLPDDLRIEQKMITHLNSPGFQRELLYNGKAGTTIKMLYREFKNDMARPAFTQQLTYDLAESDLIGFQEVRIRVSKATNTSITYIVEIGFDRL